MPGRRLLTFAPILILMGLLVFLPPDGNERAEWMQFLGRFHPLAVHFPIALILLVPVLELAGLSRRFSYLHLSASFVLGLATLGATFAAFLGWSLARSGAYSGALLTQHMWGGLSLAAVCWICWVLRARTHEPLLGLFYATALAVGVVLVSWTGYRGGQLTQGENHLTEFMPAALRDRLGLSKPSLATPANTFYAMRVEPIFSARCVTCHGPDKQKGNLRLDSYAALMKGGKHGAAVKTGNAQTSDLMRRVTLPQDNDDFMPKEGKRPLSTDQIKLIELWINAGASDTLLPDGIKDVPGATAPVAAEVTFEEIDPVAVTKLRAGIAPAVADFQKRYPNILDYESRSSGDLVLNASLLGPKFDDNDMSALAPLAEHITTADFSRTAITDHSASAIAGMKQLHALRMANTKITDTTLAALGALDQVESLNVFGTPITAAALPGIARLPKVQHVYVGQTGISESTSIPQALIGKVVF
ncbi:MAG TPA: c-type cytochrome domain-containing protein [Terriglobales bacterium]|nr:c-type cytochrome domain-containing protein [Terriglobales bacterium]